MPINPRQPLRTQGLNESDYGLYLETIQRLRNFEEVVRHHFLEGGAQRRQELAADIKTHLMTFYRAEFAQNHAAAAPHRTRMQAFHAPELVTYRTSGFEPIDCGGLCYDAKEGCKECQ